MIYYDKEGALIRQEDNSFEIYRGDGKWERYPGWGYVFGIVIDEDEAKKMMPHIDAWTRAFKLRELQRKEEESQG